MITKFNLFENYSRIEGFNDNTDKNRYDYIDMDIVMDTFLQLVDDHVEDVEIKRKDMSFFQGRLKKRILPNGVRIRNFSIYKIELRIDQLPFSLTGKGQKTPFEYIPKLKKVIVQSLNNYYNETGKEICSFFMDTTTYARLNFCRVEVLNMIDNLHEDYDILTMDNLKFDN